MMELGSEARRHRFESQPNTHQLCYLKQIYLISSCLSFLISKIGIIELPHREKVNECMENT